MEWNIYWKENNGGVGSEQGKYISQDGGYQKNNKNIL